MIRSASDRDAPRVACSTVPDLTWPESGAGRRRGFWQRQLRLLFLMLSRILNGIDDPDAATVATLAAALQYPVEFFSLDDVDEIDVRAA